MVNLTSMRPGVDVTVVLDRGDHSFVRHRTVVYYGDAKFGRADSLDIAVGAGYATRHDPVDIDLLEQIQDGLLTSDETPAGIKKYCESRFA